MIGSHLIYQTELNMTHFKLLVWFQCHAAPKVIQVTILYSRLSQWVFLMSYMTCKWNNTRNLVSIVDFGFFRGFYARKWPKIALFPVEIFKRFLNVHIWASFICFLNNSTTVLIVSPGIGTLRLYKKHNFIGQLQTNKKPDSMEFEGWPGLAGWKRVIFFYFRPKNLIKNIFWKKMLYIEGQTLIFLRPTI